MKIVNKSNIPDSLFRYLAMDYYDYEIKGDSFSATELLNPIQMVVLKRRHWDEIEVDAIDKVWSVFGDGVHGRLEKEPGIEKIERLKVTVEGREVSGKWDRIFENEITDYKVTSVFTYMYGSRNKEFMLQLSIYRWLYFKVKGVLLNEVGKIVEIFRDWAERDKKKKNYPQRAAEEVKFNLLSPEQTEQFVTNKVRAIIEAEKLSDDKLPRCSDEDRWYKPSTRTYGRCAKYCDVSKFCHQFKKEKEMESIEWGVELG